MKPGNLNRRSLKGETSKLCGTAEPPPAGVVVVVVVVPGVVVVAGGGVVSGGGVVVCCADACQSGSKSPAALFVMFVWAVPSDAIVQLSLLLPRLLSNAICVPFGDHAGLTSSEEVFVRRT